MAFFEVNNVKIVGMSAAVPQQEVLTSENDSFKDKEAAELFVKQTGVESRRISYTLTALDLEYEAAEKLINDLGWDRKEIGAIVVVTMFPDYILPNNACILQDRLGLSKECFAQDISLGCSGWPYGLSVISSLLSKGDIKKALLLTGESKVIFSFPMDDIGKMFAHGASATALEYDPKALCLKFSFGTDGSGYKTIIVPKSGMREMVYSSEPPKGKTDATEKYSVETRMNKMDLYAFCMSMVPRAIREHCNYFHTNYNDSDYIVFHQANKSINFRIAKKLNIELDRFPSSIQNFGNLYASSIPVTIVTQLKHKVENDKKDFFCAGYGVGLSWGIVQFSTEGLFLSDLVEVSELTGESEWI